MSEKNMGDYETEATSLIDAKKAADDAANVTLSGPPKRRGRPPKNPSNNPSTSSQASNQSPLTAKARKEIADALEDVRYRYNSYAHGIFRKAGVPDEQIFTNPQSPPTRKPDPDIKDEYAKYFISRDAIEVTADRLGSMVDPSKVEKALNSKLFKYSRFLSATLTIAEPVAEMLSVQLQAARYAKQQAGMQASQQPQEQPQESSHEQAPSNDPLSNEPLSNDPYGPPGTTLSS